MERNNYNTQGSEPEESKEQKFVDQTENNNLLHKESRMDNSRDNKRDPELEWHRKWKLKEIPNKEEGGENTAAVPDEGTNKS